MVWQRIDDQFGVSKKVIRIPKRRRQQCIGLWALAGNYAVRALTDGLLEEHELDELGAKHADVSELVRVDLWHAEGHACGGCPPAPPGGAVIHDFLMYNPSRSKVLGDREAERVRKAEQRSGPRPGGTPGGTPGGRGSVSEHPVPSRPDPRQTDDGDTYPDVTEVDAGEADETGFIASQAALVGIRNLSRVRVALERVVGELSDALVVDLVRSVILLATGPVRSVEAYVEKACVNSPDEVRARWVSIGGVA